MQNCGKLNADNNYYDYISTGLLTDYEYSTLYPEACVEGFTNNYSFLHIPEDGNENHISRYGYTAVPKLFGLMDTSNVEAIGALRLQNQPVLSLRGQGVIVGFVDTGIAYDLPIFRNEDGTTRLLGLWDQSIQNDAAPINGDIKTNSSLYKAEYGTHYSSADIDRALQSSDPYSIVPSRDTEGHGTFMAGVACGKPDRAGDFTGIATDSAIAVVKLKQAKPYLKKYFCVDEEKPAFSEIDIMNGVRYLLDLARYYKKPLIICIGVGTNQGGHDGRMPLSDYLSSVSNLIYVSVVQAAGNEGDARLHYYSKITEGIIPPIEIRVGPEGRRQGFCMELWGNSLSSYSVGLQSPSGDIVPIFESQINEMRTFPFLLDDSIVQIYGNVSKEQGGDYLIFFRFLTPAEGIWKINVDSGGGFSTDFHMWMPISEFISNDTYFLNPDSYTTLTSNACAINPITFGMYNHLQQGLTAVSSKGYTRTNQVKPDLLAPGVNIYGPNTDGTYTIKSGTSIAAAHGAGAAALIMEFGSIRGNYKYIGGLDIKTIMIRGAARKGDIVYPNKDWGYGALDIYQVFQNL